MSELDTCTMGAATLNAKTNVVTCELSREIGTEGESEPIGRAAMIQCLGVTALPVGPSKDGHAEGVFLSPCGPYVAGIIGGNDTRCADVYGNAKPGDTILHNTGGNAETRSRAMCKENVFSVIVGNDLVLMMDRKNSKITIAGFGHVFEMSTAQGIVMMAKGGKNGIKLQEDGSVTIWGTTVNLGGASTPGTPATAVVMGPSGITGVPAPNVFITL